MLFNVYLLIISSNRLPDPDILYLCSGCVLLSGCFISIHPISSKGSKNFFLLNDWFVRPILSNNPSLLIQESAAISISFTFVCKASASKVSAPLVNAIKSSIFLNNSWLTPMPAPILSLISGTLKAGWTGIHHKLPPAKLSTTNKYFFSSLYLPPATK